MIPRLSSFSGWLVVFSVLLLGALLQAAPVIQTQSSSQTVNETDSVTFSVTATGIGTLSYQWQKDGMDISGATSSNFHLASARPWHIGNYTVKVSDDEGFTVNQPAELKIAGINSSEWLAAC